jgi:hypothetical protein
VTSSTEDWLIASIVITEEKIRWAIKEFVSYKTTGEDGISCSLATQIFPTNQSDIFSIANDGEACGSSHKEGVVKGSSFQPCAACTS